MSQYLEIAKATHSWLQVLQVADQQVKAQVADNQFVFAVAVSFPRSRVENGDKDAPASCVPPYLYVQ